MKNRIIIPLLALLLFVGIKLVDFFYVPPLNQELIVKINGVDKFYINFMLEGKQYKLKLLGFRVNFLNSGCKNNILSGTSSVILVEKDDTVKDVYSGYVIQNNKDLTESLLNSDCPLILFPEDFKNNQSQLRSINHFKIYNLIKK